MTFYAIKDGTRVLRVVEQATEPGESFAVVASSAIPAGGRAWKELREADGALYWHDTRTLAQTRLDRIAAMRAAREAAIASPFTWDGSSFDADQVSQTRLLGVFIASQAPAWPGQLWRLANNDWRLLDASDMADVWAALQAHLAEHFTTFATREAAINAAATLAAVDAITWET